MCPDGCCMALIKTARVLSDDFFHQKGYFEITKLKKKTLIPHLQNRVGAERAEHFKTSASSLEGGNITFYIISFKLPTSFCAFGLLFTSSHLYLLCQKGYSPFLRRSSCYFVVILFYCHLTSIISCFLSFG